MVTQGSSSAFSASTGGVNLTLTMTSPPADNEPLLGSKEKYSDPAPSPIGAPISNDPPLPLRPGSLIAVAPIAISFSMPGGALPLPLSASVAHAG